MTVELDVHKQKQWERIEVLLGLDTRNDVEDSPPKKFQINRKDSPVRKICEDITTREEAIRCSLNHFRTHDMSAML